MRAIARLGISPAFLRLLQAALSQLRVWQPHYGAARRIETGPKVDMKSWLKQPKTLTSINY
jgi:hypothetical protein